MSKEQTRNPYFYGTEKHKAWAEGYAAALRDAAGISHSPRPRRHNVDIIR
jgi:hypothetical protein